MLCKPGDQARQNGTNVLPETTQAMETTTTHGPLPAELLCHGRDIHPMWVKSSPGH